MSQSPTQSASQQLAQLQAQFGPEALGQIVAQYSRNQGSTGSGFSSSHGSSSPAYGNDYRRALGPANNFGGTQSHTGLGQKKPSKGQQFRGRKNRKDPKGGPDDDDDNSDDDDNNNNDSNNGKQQRRSKDAYAKPEKVPKTAASYLKQNFTYSASRISKMRSVVRNSITNFSDVASLPKWSSIGTMDRARIKQLAAKWDSEIQRFEDFWIVDKIASEILIRRRTYQFELEQAQQADAAGRAPQH